MNESEKPLISKTSFEQVRCMNIPERDDFSSLFPNANLTRRLSVDEVTLKNRRAVKRLNEYILGEALGEGSYGKVVEAYNTTNGEIYAVKIMKKRNLRRIPLGEETVMREIGILQQLNHPNIIHLYKYFKEDDQKLYLILEYVGGSCLKALLEKAPNKTLPLYQARCIFSQLLDALEYLHSKGIVHQDIKPDNILLTTRGKIKLSDFGVAVDAKETGQTKRGTGCPGFQPPEIASGVQSVPTPATDIWQAGLLLYLMLVGKFPFEGQTLHSLFENISKGHFALPQSMDASLRDLISRILTTDPSQRLTIQGIRDHPWMNAELPFQEPLLPTPAPTIFRPSKSSRMCSCTVI